MKFLLDETDRNRIESNSQKSSIFGISEGEKLQAKLVVTDLHKAEYFFACMLNLAYHSGADEAFENTFGIQFQSISRDDVDEIRCNIIDHLNEMIKQINKMH